MKATELLQRQHRDVEAILERLHAAGQGDENRIRQELAATLVAHMVTEQEFFYPAVREALPEEILEAVEEHGLAEVELARLLAGRAGDAASDAKAAVLSEVVIRHIRREESDIFKTADRELSDDHLNRLGDQMALRFKQILDSGYQKHLQRALEEEVPRTPSRALSAKKTARRAPAAKKTKTTRRETARETRVTARRPTAKRAAVQRAGTHKPAPKPAPRTTRARSSSPSASRTRG